MTDHYQDPNTLKSYHEKLKEENAESIELEVSNKGVSFNKDATQEGQKQRIFFLEQRNLRGSAIQSEIASRQDHHQFQGNIENFIGMAQVPIGLAGPLEVKGQYAQGGFYIPLATTEGALVASYNRGMKACTLSGGVTTICTSDHIQRCPLFKFQNLHETILFMKWVDKHLINLKEQVKKVSRYAELKAVGYQIEGNTIILKCEYSTGDAAGQNMVTVCTDEICQYILQNFEIKPSSWYIESNYAGDKKATAQSFSGVRGKKVISEIVLPSNVVTQVLKTTPQKMADYWQSSTLAVVQSGAIGAQGHVANGLAALFIACGQDVACVAESSVGITRMEVTKDGHLYASLTLPSLVVGTVGGGTDLPTQSECLEMLDCKGSGKAKKLAEIGGAVALAGEISIAAALSAHHFTSAHQQLGRKKK